MVDLKWWVKMCNNKRKGYGKEKEKREKKQNR